MNRHNALNAFLLVFGTALAAMTAGHALVLSLGPPTGYAHTAQAPAIELALALLIAAIGAIARSVARRVSESPRIADWALPAVSTVRSFGPARVIVAVVAIQSAALFLGEALEQHLSGVSLGGISGLYGSTLAIAPLVHLAIGIAAGALLSLVSRAACDNVRAAVAFIRAALTWLSRDKRPALPAFEFTLAVLSGPQSHPIAHNLANRPPPASVRFA